MDKALNYLALARKGGMAELGEEPVGAITRTGKGDEAVYYMDAFEQELLNQGTCSSAFIQAATLPCDQLVDENAADLAKYGLDKPTSVLTVEYADGNSSVVELGGMLDGSGQVY